MGRVTEKMSAEASSQLYVRNLPWEVDSSGLQEIFEGYGTITECTIPVQKGSDRSRGFGYVTFARAEDAAKALEAMAGATVGDGESAREIGVALARPNRQQLARKSVLRQLARKSVLRQLARKSVL